MAAIQDLRSTVGASRKTALSELGSTTDEVLRTVNRWFSKPGPTRSLELEVLGEYCRDEMPQFINNRISRKWSPFRQVFTPIFETSSSS
jgi:hypothetical protein